MHGLYDYLGPMLEPPLFDLKLTPNRSFNRRLVAPLLGGVGLLFALMGLRFLYLGAWLIIPFMIADLLLLIWAFRASYRSGQAFEEIRLGSDALVVRKVSADGRAQIFTFQPFWTRVELEKLAVRQNRLWLASKGRKLRIGWFLAPQEREEIHALIAEALQRYRQAMPNTAAIS